LRVPVPETSNVRETLNEVDNFLTTEITADDL
jgi:hypothetical protein